MHVTYSDSTASYKDQSQPPEDQILIMGCFKWMHTYTHMQFTHKILHTYTFIQADTFATVQTCTEIKTTKSDSNQILFIQSATVIYDTTLEQITPSRTCSH